MTSAALSVTFSPPDRLDYKNDQMRLIERLSHFIQGIMLVTDSPPGDLEPLLTRTLRPHRRRRIARRMRVFSSPSFRRAVLPRSRR